MIVIGSHHHGKLIARAANVSYDDDRDMCISRVHNPGGGLMGGFIFCNYNGATMMVHAAGMGNWCCRTLMWMCFDYPFHQLGVKKLLCTVSSGNERMLKMVRRAGWASEHRVIDGCTDGDLLIFSMLPKNCRWLKLGSRYRHTNGHLGEVSNAQVVA